jgi:hypothetical protein
MYRARCAWLNVEALYRLAGMYGKQCESGLVQSMLEILRSFGSVVSTG